MKQTHEIKLPLLEKPRGTGVIDAKNCTITIPIDEFEITKEDFIFRFTIDYEEIIIRLSEL